MLGTVMATLVTPVSGVAAVQVLVIAVMTVHVNTSAAVAVTRAVGVLPFAFASAKVSRNEVTAVLAGASPNVYPMLDSVAPVTLWLTVPPTNWVAPALLVTPVPVRAEPPAAARTANAPATTILEDLRIATALCSVTRPTLVGPRGFASPARAGFAVSTSTVLGLRQEREDPYFRLACPDILYL
jgi:hypothetical protein